MTKQDVHDVRNSLQAIEIQQTGILQNQLTSKEIHDRILFQVDRMCSAIPDVWSRTAFQTLEYGISTSLIPQIPTVIQQEMARVLPDTFRDHVDFVLERSRAGMLLDMRDSIETIIREKMNEMRNVLMKDVAVDDNSSTSQVSSATRIPSNMRYNLSGQSLYERGSNDTVHSSTSSLSKPAPVRDEEPYNERNQYPSQASGYQETGIIGTELVRRKQNMPKGSTGRLRRRLQTFRKPFNLGVATIEIEASLYELRQSRTSSSSGIEFQSSMKLMPSTQLLWMLSRGTHLSWSFQHGNGWQRSLRVFPVVPDDSEIFRLIWRGKVNGVLQLLRNRGATVFDTNVDGWTPLHVSVPFHFVRFIPTARF